MDDQSAKTGQVLLRHIEQAATKFGGPEQLRALSEAYSLVRAALPEPPGRSVYELPE